MLVSISVGTLTAADASRDMYGKGKVGERERERERSGNGRHSLARSGQRLAAKLSRAELQFLARAAVFFIITCLADSYSIEYAVQPSFIAIVSALLIEDNILQRQVRMIILILVANPS